MSPGRVKTLSECLRFDTQAREAPSVRNPQGLLVVSAVGSDSMVFVRCKYRCRVWVLRTGSPDARRFSIRRHTMLGNGRLDFSPPRSINIQGMGDQHQSLRTLVHIHHFNHNQSVTLRKTGSLP